MMIIDSDLLFGPPCVLGPGSFTAREKPKTPKVVGVSVTSILLAGVTPCDVVLGVASFPGSACLPRECR